MDVNIKIQVYTPLVFLFFILHFPPLGLCQSNGVQLYTESPLTPGEDRIEFIEFLSEPFEWPMDFTFIDTNNLLVCEKKGTVHLVSDRVLQQRSVFLDISDRVFTLHSAGMYSIALHPEYPEDPRVFISYCTNPTDDYFHNQVSQFTVDVSGVPFAIPESEIILIRHESPYNYWADDGVVLPHAIHIGSEISFGPDGYLYFSMGDGNRITQEIDGDFFSGFFRIDIDCRPENLTPSPHPLCATDHYKIPADNPYVGLTEFHGEPIADGTLRSEYYAIGLRNPWRHTQTHDGRIFLADPGQVHLEEVNEILPGRNYGWDAFEGNHQHLDWTYEEDHTLPLYQYAHGNTANKGNSVSDVFLYRGTQFPEMNNKLLFCDFYYSHVRYLTPEATRIADSVVNFTQLSWVLSIEEDPADHELIFAEARNGRLLKLRRTTDESRPVEKLSQTGFFTDLKSQTPNPAAVPYTVNVPFWSDAAEKKRWVLMPDEDQRIRFSADLDNVSVPEGTIFCKHFDLELDELTGTNTVPLETRFIIKRGGTFEAFTYKWDAPDYADATLVREAGEQIAIDRINFRGDAVQQRWNFPSREQCMSCHNQHAGPVLGFTFRQLHTAPLDPLGIDQIDSLVFENVLSPPPANTAQRVLAGWDLDQYSHSFRVKSYFHVNCAPCHFPDNNRSQWDARITTPLNLSGIINGGLFNNLGDESNRLVSPGASEYSVIYHRLNATNSLAMPPIGHTRVDKRAAAEIRNWIDSLETAPELYDQWARRHWGEFLDDSARPDANPDDDNYTNREEWLLGLDPKNPLGDYSVQINTRHGGSLLKFPRKAHFSYQIDVCDGLTGNTWRPLTRLDALPYPFAEDSPFAIEIPVLDNQQFFRLQVSPPQAPQPD